METQPPSYPHQSEPSRIFDRFNNWLQESVMIKLFSIGFLLIVLLLPAEWIQDLIRERQVRAGNVMTEVASKWSGQQTVSGPVLVLPFIKQEIIDRGKDGIEIREHNQNAYFLPGQLTIDGQVTPTTLQRGLFDAVVYTSSLQLNATFAKPDLKKLNIPPDMVKWNEAYLVYGLTDQRGINENPVILSGEDSISAEPSNNIGITIRNTAPTITEDEYYTTSHITSMESSNGIVAKLPWTSEESFRENVFMKLGLKGSKRLDFVPVGKTTTVNLKGEWKDPSFDGKFIPEKRELTESGFMAEWKVLHFNRPFSQQWTDENIVLSGADFGVNLLVPVDQYQKSIRTSKYSVLIILLTFMALFMVEITQKIRIHPFQYILIGAALTIYYTLLISLSEHIGYNIAYIIATIATVALISAYALSFLKDNKLVFLFSTLLLVFYSFIFVIILQQDFSLLLGSIGLFIMIGTLMYFSRKVDWYASK